MASRSNAQLYGRWIAWFAGSNHVEGMEVRLLCGQRPVRRTDHCYMGALVDFFMFIIVCDI